ncbi:MAG: glutamine--tRNA ligase/YqeY domain fusion protein [Desulfosalsimonadaceae bacterium]
MSGENRKDAGAPQTDPAGNNGASSNFITHIVEEDLKTGKYDGRVVTRFPPEPNGYLHIGHAKSICLNFGIAKQYQGTCHLRFDDTNPLKESVEYVESIKEDVRWLGFDWEDHLYYTSDYFDMLYQSAIQLIEKGKAYVDSLTPDQIREYRGTLNEPGKESPFRNRSIAENLSLFEKMANGEFAEESCVLRAKIDMASPNIVMRDPTLYRIRRKDHHRTGSKWCVYPMYDFAHCLSDSIEKITHSICTIEFVNNRELYDWILDALAVYHPQQIEFARLNLNYTILSKRRLIQLVAEGHVNGWNDPRMPTISGLKRRGYTPSAIRKFCDVIGVARRDSTVDISLLEHCLREDQNVSAPRVMAVLNPLKVVLENYPADSSEMLEAVNNPEDASMGKREIPFSRVIYVERDDFMENPPKKFFRLAPGREVRLRYAYFIRCHDVIKDEDGNVIELRCTYDPETRGGNSPPDGRKVKATLHWVSEKHAINAEVRLYDHLFNVENPLHSGDFRQHLNPASLVVLNNCKLEPGLMHALPGTHFQFERLGYFFSDPVDSLPQKPVFNRVTTLRDTWAKIKKAQGAPGG